MKREAIGTGETIALAQKAACEILGVNENDVEFEIIHTPVKKTLGLFGGRPAEVKARVVVYPVERALEFIRNILRAMNINEVEIAVEEKENATEFGISGKDVKYIIGRRGETLEALQYISSLVANNFCDEYHKIIINVGDYREKREKTLEALALKLSSKVLKTKKLSILEPMNPYERRIIHSKIQEIPGVISWSEGEDRERHVVIGLESKGKNLRSFSNNSRRNYYRNNNKENGKYHSEAFAVTSDNNQNVGSFSQD